MKKVYLIMTVIILLVMLFLPVVKYPLVRRFSESDYYQNNMQEFQEYGFQLGYNTTGKIVLEEPTEAFFTLYKDFFEGVELIQEEYKLFPLNKFNYEIYGNLGWQVTGGTKKEKEQAAFITKFFDIYENSFYNQ